VAVSVGWQHGIALRGNGTVVTWGTPNDWASTNLAGLTGVRAISSGWQHNVVLLNDGTVRSWGGNLGDLAVTNVLSSATNVVAIAAGAYHTLALRRDGTVVAWGAGMTTNSTLWANKRQSIVPAGLNSVIAIAAGGHSSMALKSDGTVVTWGEISSTPAGVSNIVAVAAGDGHCLAQIAHQAPPLIVTQPSSHCAGLSSNTTFTVEAQGSLLSYQWKFNGGNISWGTSRSLIVTNVQPSNEGTYTVVISNGAGSVTSQGAGLTIKAPPTIISRTEPFTLNLLYGETLNLSVTATNPGSCLRLNHTWSVDPAFGVAPLAQPSVSLVVSNATAGTYTVRISDPDVGSTNVSWTVNVAGEGGVVSWGNSATNWSHLAGVTNAIALAAGVDHALYVREN
jgi:hypothetical protein